MAICNVKVVAHKIGNKLGSAVSPQLLKCFCSFFFYCLETFPGMALKVRSERQKVMSF